MKTLIFMTCFALVLFGISLAIGYWWEEMDWKRDEAGYRKMLKDIEAGRR